MNRTMAALLCITAFCLLPACSSNTREPIKPSTKARSSRKIPEKPTQAKAVEPVADPATKQKEQVKGAAGKINILVQPNKPTASDPISVQVFGYGEHTPTFVWYRNESEISRGGSAVLPAGQLNKGDKLKISVFAGDLRANKEIVIANQSPIFESVPALSEHKGQYTADIRGSDPDGDKVFLVLPAPVKGVFVDGMKIVIDPALFGSEKRTIPLGLSDGEDVAGYLYNIQIQTEPQPATTGKQ